MELQLNMLQQQTYDWGGVETNKSPQIPQILNWVYIKKPKHKLDGLLGKITYIKSKVCGKCKNCEGKTYQDCDACNKNNMYWVTYFGKNKDSNTESDYFSSKELKVCTDKKAIAEIIQRDWKY